MADFAGTLSLVSFQPHTGQFGGNFVFKIALAAATYASPVLDLSSISDRLEGVSATDVASITFTVGASAAYMVSWAPAATPTWDNMGDLKLFTATSTEATGTLTFQVIGTASLKQRLPTA
jgi:hypothetical protein